MGRALLLIVSGFALTLGNIRTNYNRINSQNLDKVIEAYDQQVLRNTAISATNLAVSQLYRDYSWRAGYDSLILDGSYIDIKVEDKLDDSQLEDDEVRITTVAQVGSRLDTIIAKMHKPAFSKYAIFTDNVPTPIYYVTGDTIRGPMHTNSQYYFAGEPYFKGKVTSVEPDFVKYNDSTNPIFAGGSEFGVARIDLPIDLVQIYNFAASGGQLFNADAELVFHADGSYDWQTFEWTWNGFKWVKNYLESGTKSLSDHNGLIATTNGHDLYVEGTISGKTTLAAGDDIYITNDLVYAHNPIYEESQDVAGLVAKGDVIIQDNEANRTNCEIHASIMALNKSFKVEHYSSGAPRGLLTILGGIIQDERGAVGTFGWIDGHLAITHGYLKNYIYDDRFFSLEPPHFPTINTAEVMSWSE